MKKITNLFYIFFTIFIYSHCTPPTNNVPILSSISPTSKVSHMPDFTLIATGTNFVSGSSIVFNGTLKTTNYISSTKINCQISSADIIASTSSTLNIEGLSGLLSKNVSVLVRNPSPDGGDSNTVYFTINSNHTFNTPSNIANTTGEAYFPAIAIDSTGNINVIWDDDSPGIPDIFFSRSTDNGTSWSTAVNISNTSKNSLPGAISVDTAGNINVVWSDHTPGILDILYSRSTDNGTSWDTPVNISNNSGESYSSVMVIDSVGNINVVWGDELPGNRDLFFSRSIDNGATWSTAVNISNNSGDSYSNNIALDNNGNINVVWSDQTPGIREIFFSRSTDNGTSWSTAVNISNNSTNSRNPGITIDSTGNINVIWEDEAPGNPDIFFSRSMDNGTSWSIPVNISKSSTNSQKPVIAIDSVGNINVVWHNFFTPGNYEIFFSRSIDNGTSWSTPVNISDNSENSFSPAIAVDSEGNINVVWHNSYLYDYQIFFTSTTQ